jgi:hypothetical protein
MDSVMARRDQQQKEISTHPFFEWMHSENVAIEDRLTFAPAGALFIMQFRDMNRWVLRFPDPKNEYEWVISLGTQEDEKHSRMFLEDWNKLDLNRRLGWKTSDLLWWLFLSPDQEVFRRSGIEFIRLAVADNDDALMRFAHSEAGEATGHVMLGNTAALADQLSAKTGLEYRYFGPFHLDLESGHVANTEGVFESAVLDAKQRVIAIDLCDRMFAIFDGIFDGFLHYAQSYVDTGTTPARPATAHRAQVDWVAPAIELHPIDSRDEDMRLHIERRKAGLRRHPFYEWLGSDTAAPADRLRSFIPMWAMDILGYRDLQKYAMTYADPRTHAERAINAWAARLSRHSDLFLSDWEALGLDELLGHDAAGALEWLFLDADMELHRGNMIAFTKLALKHSDPPLRWWMMAALESTGEEFFARIQPLAIAAEAQTGMRLDYLTGRHDPAETAADTGGAVNGAPPAPLDADQAEAATMLIDHVFDAMERQLWRSYAIGRAGKYLSPTSV